MTVIKPNAIAGINSITVASGAALAIHKADGTLIQTIAGTSGVSTFSSVSVGSATTTNDAAKSINIGLGASISQHTDNTLTFGTAGDPVAKFDASGQLLLGTGTARQKLHINASDSGAANMVFTNTTTGTSAGDGFIIGISGAEDAQINMQESANLKFSTADTEALRIDASQRLLVGNTSSRNVGGSTTFSKFQIEGTSAVTSSISLVDNEPTSSSAFIFFGKSRGNSIGESGIVQNGDTLGGLSFIGADGNDLNNRTAEITAEVNGSPANNTIPTDLVFSTSAQNASQLTERLRIESGGDVSIGGMDANTFSNYRTFTIGGAGAVDGSGIDLERSDGNIYGRFFADANGVQIQSTQSGDYIRFETAGANERIRIGSAGQIGIGGANYGSSGQVLTSQGSGSAVQWATASAGIEMAQHFRLTSSSQGNQTPLTNWEAADNSFAGSLGSSMSVSSGVFTYPSTGIYFCLYTLVGYSDSSTQNLIGYIEQTINGGTNWGNVAYGLNGIYDFSNSYPSWANTATHYIFDITDTSQQKTRFGYGAGQGPEYVKGDTNITYTGVTFIRLGDT